MRVTMAANIGLLKGHQKEFIDKFSQFVIRESSDLAETSSSAPLSDWGRESMKFTNKMSESQDIVDKSLISLYKLRRAETKRDIEEL